MKTNRFFFSFLCLCVAAPALTGCGSDDGDESPSGSAVFQELYDQGITRYVGAFTPIAEATADADGVKHWEFEVPEDPTAEPRSPLCLRGGQWTTDTREGTSDELVIFLQGGGACWDALCSATENAGPITASGILDPNLADNPVADWDVVYLPYCDGSVFSGDIDRDLPASIIGSGESGLSYQRGIQNLTSALEVGAREFPNPSRILLTGISGGAFGTIVALPLVRFLYPDTEILVFNDSGIGVAKEGNPEFVEETLLAGWNSLSHVPESCVGCTDNGHITPLLEWQLAADPNVTMSAMSFNEDFVVATTFLGIPVAEFSASLLSETGRITENYPDRYRRFIKEGGAHTTLLRATSEGELLPGVEIGSLETEIDGTTVLDWLTAYLDGGDDWRNLVDENIDSP